MDEQFSDGRFGVDRHGVQLTSQPGQHKTKSFFKQYRGWFICGGIIILAVILYIVWRQAQVKRLTKVKDVQSDKLQLLESENNRLRSALSQMASAPSAQPAQFMGANPMATMASQMRQTVVQGGPPQTPILPSDDPRASLL